MSVRLNPVGSQFLISLLWNLCSESVSIKRPREEQYWDPVEDSDTGSPSSITVKMEYLLAF